MYQNNKPANNDSLEQEKKKKHNKDIEPQRKPEKPAPIAGCWLFYII